MRSMTVLLRLVLCLVLVAAGIAGAQAATRMAVASMPAASVMATAATATDGASMPCHRDAAPAKATHAGDDAGCKDGRCDCPCAPVLPDFTVAANGPAVALRAPPSAAPALRAHREPRLPHLIRPPIG